MKNQSPLDIQDPLKKYRSQFYVPQINGKDSIYFCGNLMGLQPKKIKSLVLSELENWQNFGVKGNYLGDKPWVKYHQLAKKSISRLVGAKPNEVIAMNNLTSNLHLALTSFFRPDKVRNKIIIEKDAFPSDYYALYSQLNTRGLDPLNHLIEIKRKNQYYISNEEILDTIEDVGEELCLILLPGTHYLTGQSFDIKKVSEKAHEVGAYAGFDLAHSIGNTPLSLHDSNVDFGVWCSYKYLNAGPSNLGGLFIHENHIKNKEFPRLESWWSHDSSWSYGQEYKFNYHPSVDSWQLSHSDIFGHASLLGSLKIFDAVGIDAIRKKSLLLTGLLEELILESSLKQKIEIITPSNSEERGSQLTFLVNGEGKMIFDYLTEKGVILDYKEPNLFRIAPVPLYNSFQDVYDFFELLKKSML